MGFWIYMMLMDILIPVIMVIFGGIFRKKTPVDINYIFGYRTKRSMKNNMTWNFAHAYCGKLWFIIGSAIIPISILAMLPVTGKDEDTIGWVGAAILIAQMVIIVITVIMTERKLKITFDDYGRLRG